LVDTCLFVFGRLNLDKSLNIFSQSFQSPLLFYHNPHGKM
jgi:hypothetical protein